MPFINLKIFTGQLGIDWSIGKTVLPVFYRFTGHKFPALVAAYPPKTEKKNPKQISTLYLLPVGPTFVFCYLVSTSSAIATDAMPSHLLKMDRMYRDRLKGLYVVARNFFLLLLNFSVWLCLAVA